MKEAVVTQATNSLQSEVIFHCNAVLTDVIVPSSIDIDVKWLVDGKNVHSETFNAGDRVSGVLTEEHWSMGQTVKMFIILDEVQSVQLSASPWGQSSSVSAVYLIDNCNCILLSNHTH